MELLDRENNKSPFPPPPSKASVDLMESKNLGGPTKEQLRLDVTGYKVKSKWNRAGAKIIAREYIKREGSLTQDLAIVQECVLRHIPALIIQYNSLGLENANSVIRANVTQAAERNLRNSRRKGVRTETNWVVIGFVLTYIQ